MRLFEFADNLFEGYREAERDFSADADLGLVKSTIAAYRELVSRNQFQGDERNIDYWRKLGWQAFKTRVNELSSTASKTQVKRRKVAGDFGVLRDNDEWFIVVPFDKTSSVNLGANTAWCTTKPEWTFFEEYFYREKSVLIYLTRRSDGGRWAIRYIYSDGSIAEIRDVDDEEVSDEFTEQTQLLADDLVEECQRKFSDNIESAYKIYGELKEYIKTTKDLTRTPKMDQAMTTAGTPQQCLDYINHNGPNDWPLSILSKAISVDKPAYKVINLKKPLRDGELLSLLRVYGGIEQFSKNALADRKVSDEFVDKLRLLHYYQVIVHYLPQEIQAIQKPDNAVEYMRTHGRRQYPQYIFAAAIRRDPEIIKLQTNFSTEPFKGMLSSEHVSVKYKAELIYYSPPDYKDELLGFIDDRDEQYDIEKYLEETYGIKTNLNPKTANPKRVAEYLRAQGPGNFPAELIMCAVQYDSRLIEFKTDWTTEELCKCLVVMSNDTDYRTTLYLEPETAVKLITPLVFSLENVMFLLKKMPERNFRVVYPWIKNISPDDASKIDCELIRMYYNIRFKELKTKKLPETQIAYIRSLQKVAEALKEFYSVVPAPVKEVQDVLVAEFPGLLALLPISIPALSVQQRVVDAVTGYRLTYDSYKNSKTIAQNAYNNSKTILPDLAAIKPIFDVDYGMFFSDILNCARVGRLNRINPTVNLVKNYRALCQKIASAVDPNNTQLEYNLIIKAIRLFDEYLSNNAN